jgi:ElaB/YqjD/DUF883 family membrane-anchored ribosome-binding protein
MAKKTDKTPPSEATEGPDRGAAPSDATEAAVDDSPEVTAAERAVRRAEAELEKARELYNQVRRQATEQLNRVREKTMGELADDTLKLVRKYPGPSVVIAILVGFFLGRLFRR